MDPNQIATDQAAVDAAEAQLQADVTKLATDEATHMTTHTPEAEQAVAADIAALQADEQAHETAHAQLVEDQTALAAQQAAEQAHAAVTQDVAEAAPVVGRTIHDVLADIEQHAIFWGGEAMTQLRHLVAEARNLLS